jgi:hypothetical protein
VAELIGFEPPSTSSTIASSHLKNSLFIQLSRAKDPAEAGAFIRALHAMKLTPRDLLQIGDCLRGANMPPERLKDAFEELASSVFPGTPGEEIETYLSQKPPPDSESLTTLLNLHSADSATRLISSMVWWVNYTKNPRDPLIRKTFERIAQNNPMPNVRAAAIAGMGAANIVEGDGRNLMLKYAREETGEVQDESLKALIRRFLEDPDTIELLFEAFKQSSRRNKALQTLAELESSKFQRISPEACSRLAHALALYARESQSSGGKDSCITLQHLLDAHPDLVLSTNDVALLKKVVSGEKAPLVAAILQTLASRAPETVQQVEPQKPRAKSVKQTPPAIHSLLNDLLYGDEEKKREKSLDALERMGRAIPKADKSVVTLALLQYAEKPGEKAENRERAAKLAIVTGRSGPEFYLTRAQTLLEICQAILRTVAKTESVD